MIIATLGVISASEALAATIKVNTLADPAGASGACSLRQAITNANNRDQSGSTGCAAGSGDDAITFGVAGTIKLVDGALEVGSPSNQNRLTISGSAKAIVLSGNKSVQVVYVHLATTLNLDHLTIADGSALGPGAGIANFGTLNISFCRFLSNQATDFGGGAIGNTGTLTVSNSTFINNSSGGVGGGIYNNRLSTVNGSVFILNSSAGGGGGIATVGSGDNFTDGTLNVTNSTFARNTGAFNGGGGILDEGAHKVSISSCTFNNNRAINSSGANVANDLGDISMSNTIVSNGARSNCAGGITDAGYNLSDDNSCGFSAPSRNATNPKIDQSGPQNNGGPTQTIALLPKSPAIDVIPLAQCPATDQRGFRRPDPGDNSGACDIGAFEFGARSRHHHHR